MNLQTTNNEAISPQQTRHFLHFTDFADDYIKKIEKGETYTDKKVRYSQSAIKNYKVATNHYKDFEILLKQRTKTIEINHTFLQAYERYLISKKLALNTVSEFVSKIKAMANVLVGNNIISVSFRSIKTRTEQTTQVYLTETELKKMKSAKLTNSEAKVLDVFLIACFTGLRFSVLQKFMGNPLAYIKDHEGIAYIDIVSDKTGEQSIIPMHKEVKRILGDYLGDLPKYSEQYVRSTIKTIAKKAEIDQPIPKRITKGGAMVEELVPKWSLVSSHTGRRSFVSNISKYVHDKNAIMAMSGHTSEKQLSNYNRAEKLDKVLPAFNNEFFNKTI